MKELLQGQVGVRFGKLTDEQCAKIHDASCRILEQVGVEAGHPRAREILRDAGGKVDGERVRLSRDLIDWALVKSPPGFTLYGRSEEHSMLVEGTNVFYGNGSETPIMIDHRSGARRQGTLADVTEGVKLVDALPHIDFVMSFALPWDLDTDVVYLEQFKAMMANTTKPFAYVAPRLSDVAGMVAMMEAEAGGEDAHRARPRGLSYINVTHPLRHSQDDLEKLMFVAGKGIPLVYNPAVLRGASGPMTIPAALAVANAGELFGLVLAQLINEGTPVSLSGGTQDKLDMHSTLDVYSAPENRVAFAEMANWYDKAHWGLGGASDSKVVDEQAAAEAALSLTLESLAGSNLIHDIGYMESGLSNSLAQLVVCDEIIGWIKRFMQPLEVNDETLALDMIERVAPEGDYLLEDHTMNHLNDDWYPRVFDHRTFDKWTAAGGKTLSERAAVRVDELIQKHEIEPLADVLSERLDEIIQEFKASE